ncbi:type I-B CRISPR-associated endonuclease Cas1 [Candidatus Poribacteria bacterium]|nr:type I-B CRISPR-associated endonuclease Cas1 [Candidatus Poribacteria bacterium]
MRKTIYLASSGEFKRKDNTLYFETKKGRKYIPIQDTQDIMVFGEVTINKKLLDFLSQNGIPVHFFNYYGYYSGTFYPREHLNSGHLVLMQAQHYIEQASRLEIAKSFVRGGMENMAKVLSYYARRGTELSDVTKGIEEMMKQTGKMDDVDALMGIEGNAREYYYRAFDAIVDDPEFAFESRTKRPPRNRINALISFGNSMVYTTVLSEIYKTHLDPRIGFLHTTNFRRFSLNLDVAEIFKPLIVDRLIFTLLNKKMISSKDFQDETGGIMLKDKGRITFLTQFDQKMKTTVKYPSLQREVSYKRLIRLELYKLEKHLLGEAKYKPFIASW